MDRDADPDLVVPDLLMAHACANTTQDRRAELAHLVSSIEDDGAARFEQALGERSADAPA